MKVMLIISAFILGILTLLFTACFGNLLHKNEGGQKTSIFLIVTLLLVMIMNIICAALL